MAEGGNGAPRRGGGRLGRGPRRGGALRAWGPPLGPLPPPRAQVEAGGGEGPEQEKRPGGQGLRADPQGVPAPGEKAEEEGRGPGREADGQEGREEDEEGGEEGGFIVATGTPEQVAQVDASHTGQALKRVLATGRNHAYGAASPHP